VTAISYLRPRILGVQHLLQTTLLRIHIRAVLDLELELPQHRIISMSQLTRRQIRRPPGTDNIASLIAQRVHPAPSRRSITSTRRSGVFCGKDNALASLAEG
jgi:hypothetical protein